MTNSSFYSKNPIPSEIDSLEDLVAQAAADAASTAENAEASELSALHAANSEANASASATAAANSASQASGSKDSAAASASAAATSASGASASAATANTKASEALASKEAAAVSEGNAATSATSASTSAATATTKASEAAASKTGADAAKVASETARDAAAASNASAATHEANSWTNQQNAAANETNSYTNRLAAEAAKTAAETARDWSAGHAGNAYIYKEAALGYRNEAEGFKNAAATSEANAAASAAAAATFDPSVYYNKTQSDARYASVDAPSKLKTASQVHGGGIISVTTSREVKWSQRFITIASGGGTWVDINMPVTGYVVPCTDGTTVTVTANGIPLEDWASIWFDPALFWANGGGVANGIRIIRHNFGASYPQADWVPICHCNGDNGVYYFPRGLALKANQSRDTSKMVWHEGNFTPSNYYTNTQVYTKTEVDTIAAGKANASHTHTTSQVTGLDTALAGKLNSTSPYALGAMVIDGGTGAGSLEIIGSNAAGGPALWLHRGGVKKACWLIDGGGTLHWYDQGGTSHARIRNDGYVESVGYVTTGGASYGNDGNIYMPWAGQYLSGYLSSMAGTTNDRVHRVQFSGYGESAAWNAWAVDAPQVITDCFTNSGGITTRRYRTLQMHIPASGGWVNVWVS